MPKDIWKIILRVSAVVAFVAVAFYFARLARESDIVRTLVSNYGYLGVFALSIFTGFNLVVPIPTIAFLPLIVESGLNFWTAIIIITAGVSLADSISFFIGRTAKKITGSTNNKVIHEFKKAEKKSRLAPLFGLFFFISFAPLPAEIVLVPMGYLEYRFIQIFPIILAGNLIFNLLVATGIISLFKNLI